MIRRFFVFLLLTSYFLLPGFAYAENDGGINEIFLTENVGIGTGLPTGRLDVRGDEVRIWTGVGSVDDATGDGDVYVEGDMEVDGHAYSNNTFVISGSIEVDGGLYCSGAGITGIPDAFSGLTPGFVPRATASDAIADSNMYDDGVNVGIGSNRAGGKLEVQKTGAFHPFMVSSSGSTNGDYLIVVSSGNVGINSTVPTGVLEIQKVGSDKPFLVSSSGVTDGDYLVVLSGGNVGVGSVTPNTKFDVVGSGATAATSSFQVHNSAGWTSLAVYDDGNVGMGTFVPLSVLALRGATDAKMTFSNGTITGYVGVDNTASSVDLGAISNHPVRFEPNNTVKMVVTTAGNVGVGTTTPFGTLEVQKISNYPLILASSAGNTDGDYFMVMSNGNVGIGSNAPTSPLEVKTSADQSLFAGSVTDAITTDRQIFSVVGTALNTATGVALDQISTSTANDVDVTAFKIERGTNDAQIKYDEGAKRWQMDMGTSAGLGDVPVTLDRAAALVNINTDNTERTLYTYTVKGGILQTDRMLAVTLYGDILNNTGADATIVFKIKYGATTLYADTTSAITTNAATRGWVLTFYIANLGATNSQALGGNFLISDAGATTGTGDLAGGTAFIGQAIFGTSAIDSTADAAITVTSQHSVSNANQRIRQFFGSTRLK